mgnify:CR=1 FL=1
MSTLELTAKNLDETIKGNEILVIDFWASWCGPCKMFGPVFEKAAEQHTDIAFAKCNTEEQQEVAAAFGIRSIPTLAVFKEQTLIFLQPGALPGNALEEVVTKVRDIDMDEVRKEIEAHEKEHGHEHGPDCDHD